MDFAAIEDQDGVRLPWNVFVNQRNEATRNVVPISVAYTPLRRADLPELIYEPLTCKPPCKAVINPFCQVKFVIRIFNK